MFALYLSNTDFFPPDYNFAMIFSIYSINVTSAVCVCVCVCVRPGRRIPLPLCCQFFLLTGFSGEFFPYQKGYKLSYSVQIVNLLEGSL